MRYREHAIRRYKGKPDRYFAIRYRINGKSKEKGLGWASSGWSVKKASLELMKLKQSDETRGAPQPITEMRPFTKELAQSRQAQKGIQFGELNSRLQRIPIAVIGMASIFPQAANLSAYWDNIIKRIDCITDIPLNRWDIRDYYDSDPKAPDKSYCKRGGFIPDIDFDPTEFGLPPNTLELMDVSQLLALVVAREVLEDAGYGGSLGFGRDRIGITLGVGGGQKLVTPLTSRLQYPVWEKVLRSSGVSKEDAERVIEKIKKAYIGWEEDSFPGLLGNVVAGRVANRLNLGGMNCVLDAACASSLTAIKMAVSELLEYRSDIMISGGVDTDNSIFMYMCFSKTPAFTTGDKCCPFDRDSDGILIGEGIGMVALKRLEDAERDNDRIYAVIRGIGASSDGRAKSIYAPRAEGQAKALKRAYEDAGIPPSSIGLLEAHGTGTVPGDLAEFAALTDVFREGNPRRHHIALGSVKSQIGHTKAAAGIAGFIKAALALHHEILPATINITAPNPNLNLENSPFYLNTETQPWFNSENDHPRRAGVSSFGFGGTNFHFVLEEYKRESGAPYRLHKVPQCLILSESTPERLMARCSDALRKLESESGEQHFQELFQICKSAKVPTSAARLGFVTESLSETRDLLRLSIQTLQAHKGSESWDSPKGIYYRRKGMDLKGRVVALFAGQGSAYLEMGKELVYNFPPLMDAYYQMDRLFVEDGWKPLSGIVFPKPSFDPAQRAADEEQLQRTEHAQPAIGVFSAGLYKIFERAGFQPDFVAGHSFGELTALWVAGVLSEGDYFALARARGKAMAAPDDADFEAGSMCAVMGDIEKIQADITDFPHITIANLNSKSQVVLAGPTQDMIAVQELLHNKDYSVVPLPVSAAFHTSLVGHAHRPFAKAIQAVSFQSPRIPVYSNATGTVYPPEPEAIQEMLKGHILQTVRFKEEIENIYKAGGNLFIEFGPKNILTKLVDNILEHEPHLAVALNVTPKEGSDRQLRQAFVKLCVAGLSLRDIDPYRLDYPAPVVKKPNPMTVTLSGANYVSEKTRNAFIHALNNGHRITQAKGSNEMTQDPAAESDAQVLSHEKLSFDTEAKSLQAQGPPSPHDVPPGNTATDRQRVLGGLEQTLALFFKHQSETLKVHEQYLSNNVEYAKTCFELMRQQYSLISNSPHARVPDSLERSMVMFHNHQGETLRVHEEYLKKQAEVSQSALQIIKQQVSLQPGVTSMPQPLIAPSDEATIPYPAPISEDAEIAVEPIGEGPAITTPPEVQPSPPDVSPTSVPDMEALTQTMLKVVGEKTGYPVEILELDMDMEADLGIDSIKRVEILGTMMELYPDLPELKPEELAEIRTLGEVVEHIKKRKPFTGVSCRSETLAQHPDIEERVLLSIVKPKSLPPPDYLEFTQPDNHICLVTDDGTLTTVRLAESLKNRGWKVVVLGLPSSTISEQMPLSEDIPRVVLEDLSETHLKETLKAISDEYGEIGGLIHLNPPSQLESDDGILFFETSKDILRHVFLMAKHVKASINQTEPAGRRFFITVAHLDGALGLGEGNFGVIDGGLFGLTKTLNLEWEPVFCRAIDLGTDLDTDKSVSCILAELHDPDARLVEVGYSLQGRATLVAEKAERIPSGGHTGKINPASVFVVSGGAKGVTAECIAKLASLYRGKYILLGRSLFKEEEPAWAKNCFEESELKARIMGELKAQGEKPTPMKIQELMSPILSRREIANTLRTIQQAGAEAAYVSVDVTDAEAVRERLSSVVNHFGPITGIIHGAGVLADKLIENKTIRDFESVYGTKVKGLEALLRCVDNNELEYLILFSSAAGFYGNVAQSDYAIANDILNKAAHLFKRQHPHCHVNSFNWGPWEGGMVNAGLVKMFTERNIQVIPIEAGTRVFVDQLTSDNRGTPQVLVGSWMGPQGGTLNPALQTYRVSRTLDLEGNPFLQDHVIGGKAVLPTVCVIAWMADACEQCCPGYKFFRYEDYRLFKGIVFDETLADKYMVDIKELRKSEPGEIEFEVNISSQNERDRITSHYRARITLLRDIPETPIYEDFNRTEPQIIEGTSLYQDGTLFHGPSFHVVGRVINLSPERLTAECRVPEIGEQEQGQFPVRAFNPYAADAQFQCMVIWARHYLEAGSLPSRAQTGEQYRPMPPGHKFYVSLEVKRSTKTSMVADITTHDEAGKIYMRLLGAEVTISTRLNQLFAQSSLP